MAREYLQRHPEDADSDDEMSFEGYTRTVEALYLVVDVLQTLCVITAGEKKRPDPLPRPQAAIESVRTEIAYERHLSLVRQLLPNTDEGG